MNKAEELFGELLSIMDNLRDKCPWDKEQTMESLRYLTIEETYELSDAILNNDLEGIKGELGDLMLHIVFYSKIGTEKGAFNINDVLLDINKKLMHRHPHIYGDVKVTNAKNVKDNWEKIKLQEGKKSVLEGIPKSMPSLVKAFRMQEKAAGIGFNWENKEQVWEKVKEEMNEFTDELNTNTLDKNKNKIEEEFGDLLFALTNYARFININPEDALEKANKKFIRRFQYIEEKSNEDGKKIELMKLDEMEEYWQKAKEEGL